MLPTKAPLTFPVKARPRWTGWRCRMKRTTLLTRRPLTQQSSRPFQPGFDYQLALQLRLPLCPPQPTAIDQVKSLLYLDTSFSITVFSLFLFSTCNEDACNTGIFGHLKKNQGERTLKIQGQNSSSKLKLSKLENDSIRPADVGWQW